MTTFQTATKSGNKPADQEMLGVSEMLMRQLLKLDSIEADGDAKALRRTEVCHIPAFIEPFEKNLNPRTYVFLQNFISKITVVCFQVIYIRWF